MTRPSGWRGGCVGGTGRSVVILGSILVSETGHEAEHRATGLRAKSVPRPARAAQLETSLYGYPIMAAVDRLDGRAQFGTVSTSRLVTLATFDLCGLCGLPFGKELRWQVSTHIDAVENPADYWNAFSEPPLHKICLMYSALVCPFLRSPPTRARDPESRVDADLGSALLAYGLADTEGVHFDPSNSHYQLSFLQSGLADADRWGSLEELEARYREALVGEEPLSVEPNLAVIAGALNRCDAGDIADPGAQVFIAALVCGAALVPQVRELSETQAIFDDDGYSYLRDTAISWAGGEKEAIPLGPNASPVLAAALAWLRSSDPLPTVLAGWRAAARQLAPYNRRVGTPGYRPYGTSRARIGGRSDIGIERLGLTGAMPFPSDEEYPDDRNREHPHRPCW
jgi:hypothetical protein